MKHNILSWKTVQYLREQVWWVGLRDDDEQRDERRPLDWSRGKKKKRSKIDSPFDFEKQAFRDSTVMLQQNKKKTTTKRRRRTILSVSAFSLFSSWFLSLSFLLTGKWLLFLLRLLSPSLQSVLQSASLLLLLLLKERLFLLSRTEAVDDSLLSLPFSSSFQSLTHELQDELLHSFWASLSPQRDDDQKGHITCKYKNETSGETKVYREDLESWEEKVKEKKSLICFIRLLSWIEEVNESSVLATSRRVIQFRTRKIAENYSNSSYNEVWKQMMWETDVG